MREFAVHLAGSIVNSGTALIALKRYEEALGLLTQSKAMLEDAMQKSSWRVSSRPFLGRCLYQRGHALRHLEPRSRRVPMERLSWIRMTVIK